uniref:Uncharacterized protein n=1 Tax=Cannabis sativa TaxID=3483 RepID=A0A803NXR6_CANSA
MRTNISSHHGSQDLQSLKNHPTPAKPINQNPTKLFHKLEWGTRPHHLIKNLDGLFGLALSEVGSDVDGRHMVLGHWAASKAGEEGHGHGDVRLGGKGVEEGRKRDGIERWICKEGGDGEVGRSVELVREAETREEEVDLSDWF